MSTALVPFECPKCHRQYRMELDFVKLRRLNRVAICGKCHGRYSVSVRMGRGAKAFEPDPYAAERLLRHDRAARPIRDERDSRQVRHGKELKFPGPKTWPDTPAHVFVGESVPPGEEKLEVEGGESLPFNRVRTLDAKSGRNASDTIPDSTPRGNTLDGVGPDSGPPPSDDDHDEVPMHVIVEVGALDDDDIKPTRKAYRPNHLVTLPGIGIPTDPPPDD